MSEIFDFVSTLKELDSVKDQLRSLRIKNTLNTEKASTAKLVDLPLNQIREFTKLLSANSEIDLTNLFLPNDIEDNDTVKIKVEKQFELLQVAKIAVQLLNFVDVDQIKFPEIIKFKKVIQDAINLRKNCLNLCAELSNFKLEMDGLSTKAFLPEI